MKSKVCRILVGLGWLMAASLSAAPLEWKFPLTRSCHEGLAFSDGTTGVLVWGGGETIRFTVGRGDLWDHRGGYPWLPSQSYTNIVDAIQKGEKDRLLGLFKKVSAWCGWCVPWAAVLHLHMGEAEASVETLKAWEHYFMNDGRGSRCWPYHRGYSTLCLARFDAAGKPIEGQEIMQMDGQCAAVAALMELMVHEVNGKPEFFRGCPASWKDVSFENIRLSDGRRASGRRVNGKADVKIVE